MLNEEYLDELTELRSAAISAALANFKQDNPNVDWRNLSNDDFNTQILAPALDIFGVDNEAKLKEVSLIRPTPTPHKITSKKSNIQKFKKGGVVLPSFTPQKSTINSQRPNLNTTTNLPYYTGTNTPPISIVADVVYKPKYTIEELMDDTDGKIKAPKELKEIAVNYGKVLDRLDTKGVDDRDIELSELNDTLDKFYTHPLNLGDKDLSGVQYAENLANQLSDIYKTKVNVIAYDNSDEKSKKAMQNIDKNAIVITNDELMTKMIPATNILFADDVSKFGVDMLVNMDKTKEDIVRDLTNRYSTPNNPLIGKNIQFDKTMPITIQGGFGALGQYMGDEIRLTSLEDEYKSSDDTWQSTLRHELRHSGSYDIFTNSNNYQTIKKLIPDNREDNLGYYRDPDEVEARLYQIRNDAGITEKDRGTDKIIDKLNTYINKGVHIKAYNDLLKVTDKPTIIKLLQEVAVNTKLNTKNIS